MEFIPFHWKEADYKTGSDKPGIIRGEIRRLRAELETYIAEHPEFAPALKPLPAGNGAPEIVERMCSAGEAVGVGPMAAVAGTFAQMACEKALREGAEYAVVENGGDIFIGGLKPGDDFFIGIYSAASPALGQLAFRIPPDRIPLGICSSSSNMGHSLSFGACDLVTVFARNCSLADAAATAACNAVQTRSDIEGVLAAMAEIEGVSGLMIVLGENVGMAGDVPELVRHRDPHLTAKVTRNRLSGFV